MLVYIFLPSFIIIFILIWLNITLNILSWLQENAWIIKLKCITD